MVSSSGTLIALLVLAASGGEGRGTIPALVDSTYYATNQNWYDPHYSSLVEGITEPIAPFGNRQASFFLKGKEEDFRMFAVAVNKIGQPTILAGEYGKGRFVLSGDWEQFYEPESDATKRLSANAVKWLAGKGGEAKAKVAHRDYGRLPGHEGDDRFVKAGELDASKYDVYAGYTAYEFSEEDAARVLKWVGEEGRGLLLVGDVKDQEDKAKYFSGDVSVNRIASKLGAWFVGKDPYAHSFKPTLVAPPLTFFGELLAGVTENPDSMIRVTAEIPYALAAEPESNQLWTAVAGLAKSLNNKEVWDKDYYIHSTFVKDMMPDLLLKDDLPTSAYAHKAWDIDTFPFDVADGAEAVPSRTVTVQMDTRNNFMLDDPVWIPTGMYAGGGQVVDFKFDGPLVGSGAQIQVGQHVLDCGKWGRKYAVRSPWITQYLKIERKEQRAMNPWGGPIYILLPKQSNIGSTEVTIEGAYPMVTFKLDEMTDQEYITAVKASKVPWVDLQAPGWISFIPTLEFAKTMTEPTKIMDFWRDKMKVVSKFAGFGDKGRPRMERFLYDSAAQGVMYGGYPMEANPSRVAYYLTYENLHSRSDYPWGAYHEIGHGHQQSMWNIKSECTVNWFTVAMSLATEGITDEYWTYHRAHNLNRYQKQGGGLDHYGNWVCLDSYALLGERFGWDTYRVLQEKYFNDAELRKTSGDKRYGTWALEYSKLVKANTCDHFKFFGWPIDDKVMAECSKLPDVEDLVKPYLEPKVETTAKCEEGWHAYGDACYYFSQKGEVATWSGAEQECASKGGHLASCLGRWELFHLSYQHEYGAGMQEYYWFGMADSNKDLTYEWLDGSVAPADSVPWDWPHRPPVEGHGPGRCGYLRKGMVRTWGDCGWKTNYVCKKGGGACGPEAKGR